MSFSVARGAKLTKKKLAQSAGHSSREKQKNPRKGWEKIGGSSDHIDPDRIHLNRTIGAKTTEEIVERAELRIMNATGGVDAAGRRHRSDAIHAIEFICTSDKTFFEGKSEKEVMRWASDSAQWFRDEFGADNFLSGILHLDEETPHLHLYAVPITEDDRLSAKDVIGNRKTMRERQTRYNKAVAHWGLQRGRSASDTQAEHVRPDDFRAARDQYQREIEQSVPGALATPGQRSEFCSQMADRLARAEADRVALHDSARRSTRAEQYLQEWEQLTGHVDPAELVAELDAARIAQEAAERLLAKTKAESEAIDKKARIRAFEAGRRADEAAEVAKQARGELERIQQESGAIGELLKERNLNHPKSLARELEKAKAWDDQNSRTRSRSGPSLR